MKILKIGADWSNGCLIMRPRFAEIEKENPWLVTEYHNFDTDKNIVHAYKIDSGKLPVFIFLDNAGKEIVRFEGEIEKNILMGVISENKDK